VVDGARAHAAGHLTVIDVKVEDGPLDALRLGWVARLYGDVDPRFRDQGFLEHLLVRGPAGPAMHSFALAGGDPVGHAAIVPTPARRGDHPLLAGKLEALVVTEAFRGRQAGDVPVARTLLKRLYERADAVGFDLIHAYVSPPVGRVIGFTRLDGVGSPSLVALIRPRGVAAGRRDAAESVLRHAQAAARRVAGLALRIVGEQSVEPIVRPAEAGDTDLLDTPRVPPGSWAVVAENSFEWYASTPSIRVLELTGPFASRALIQLPEAPNEPFRVAAWHAPTPRPRSAARFLLAAADLAEQTGAGTLRLQVPQPDASLGRAARALGFVRRHDLTTLWVRTHDPSLSQPTAVVPTAMLYLGF
jgi:GNAT superfamily N-acetyltransferase